MNLLYIFGVQPKNYNCLRVQSTYIVGLLWNHTCCRRDTVAHSDDEDSRMGFGEVTYT